MKASRPNLSNLLLSSGKTERNAPEYPAVSAAQAIAQAAARAAIVKRWQQVFAEINKELVAGEAETAEYPVEVVIAVDGARRQDVTQLKIGFMVPQLPVPTTIQEVPGLLTSNGIRLDSLDIKFALVPVVKWMNPATRQYLNVGLLYPGMVCATENGNLGCIVDANGVVQFEPPPPMLKGVATKDYYQSRFNIATYFTTDALVDFQTPVLQRDDRQRFEIESFAVREIWEKWDTMIDGAAQFMTATAAAAGFEQQA